MRTFLIIGVSADCQPPSLDVHNSPTRNEFVVLCERSADHDRPNRPPSSP